MKVTNQAGEVRQVKEWSAHFWLDQLGNLLCKREWRLTL